MWSACGRSLLTTAGLPFVPKYVYKAFSSQLVLASVRQSNARVISQTIYYETYITDSVQMSSKLRYRRQWRGRA